jgi:hypothetical protein
LPRCLPISPYRRSAMEGVSASTTSGSRDLPSLELDVVLVTLPSFWMG